MNGATKETHAMQDMEVALANRMSKPRPQTIRSRSKTTRDAVRWFNKQTKGDR